MHSEQSCKSDRVRALVCQNGSGLHTKCFRNDAHFSPVAVEGIKLIFNKQSLIVNYLVMFTLLVHQYPAVTRILIDSVNLVFGPKSGFKNKCRVRASK